MVNTNLDIYKYVKPKAPVITAPPETTAPAMDIFKYTNTSTPAKIQQTTVPKAPAELDIYKYANTGQSTEPKGIMNTAGQSAMMNPVVSNVDLDTFGKLGKGAQTALVLGRLQKDASVSIPMIALGLIQGVTQANRDTINQGIKWPAGLFPDSGDKTIIDPKYTKPSGVGYLPAFVYNMLVKPGADVMKSLTESDASRKELLASWLQHPLLGPVGTLGALAAPVMAAEGAFKATSIPELGVVKPSLYGPKSFAKPSMASELTGNAWKKFIDSPKGALFKERMGLLPQQQGYRADLFAAENILAEDLATARGTELIEITKRFTPEEHQAFMEKLEMPEALTPEAIQIYKDMGYVRVEPTPNVLKAVELWKEFAAKASQYTEEAKGENPFISSTGTAPKKATDAVTGMIKKEYNAKQKALFARIKNAGGLPEEIVTKYGLPKSLIAKVKKPTTINMEGLFRQVGDNLNSHMEALKSGDMARVATLLEERKALNKQLKGVGATVDTLPLGALKSGVDREFVRNWVEINIKKNRDRLNIVDELNQPIVGEAPKVADALTDAVIKKYGTTDVPSRAAFITKDGQMIKGAVGDETIVRLEHKEIIADTGASVQQFLNGTGNIRIGVPIKGKAHVEVFIDGGMPTPAQLAKIGDIIKQTGERTFWYDLVSKDARVLVGKEGTLAEFVADSKRLIPEEAPKAGVIPGTEVDPFTGTKPRSPGDLGRLEGQLDLVNEQIAAAEGKKFPATQRVAITDSSTKEWARDLLDRIDQQYSMEKVRYDKANADYYPHVPRRWKTKNKYALSVDELAMSLKENFPEGGFNGHSTDMFERLANLRKQANKGVVETINVNPKDIEIGTKAWRDADLRKQIKPGTPISDVKFKAGSISELYNRRANVESLIETIKKGGTVGEHVGNQIYAQTKLPQLIKEVRAAKTFDEVAKTLRMTKDQIIDGLASATELGDKVTKQAAEMLVKKMGYREVTGEVGAGRVKTDTAVNARWQPMQQMAERTLGREFTIQELRDIGFAEPDYYHHAFPMTMKQKLNPLPFARSHTGPNFTPSYDKARAGAQGYTGNAVKSISNFQYQFYKFKFLNELKDTVFKNYGEKLLKAGDDGYAAQAARIEAKELVPYGKGKFLDELPGGGGGKKVLVKEDIVLDRAVANEFNTIFKDKTLLEGAMRAYFDPITNAWKIPVLALSPRWVVNNLLGNFVLNTLGGVGPMAYVDAVQYTIRALKDMNKAKKAGAPITFVDALIKQGIPGEAARGIFRGEGAAWDEGVPLTKMQKAGQVVKYVPNKIYQFNSAIESFYRSAHYLDKIGKDFTPAAAIKSVNEFLFDYAHLSDRTKRIFRRADPFIAWHQNILRLYVTYPFKYPKRFLVASYFQKLGVEAYDDKLRAQGVNPDNVPEYYKQMWLLPWKDEKGKDFYISLRGVDPLADIGNIASFSVLNPVFKIIYERMSKQNSYTGQPFSSPKVPYGSKKRVLPSIWRHVGSQFPQFKVIEDIIRPYSIYDTGEPWLDKNGNPIYTKDGLLSLFGIMGFKMTARDMQDIYDQAKADEKLQNSTDKNYAKKLKLFQAKHPEYKVK